MKVFWFANLDKRMQWSVDKLVGFLFMYFMHFWRFSRQMGEDASHNKSVELFDGGKKNE